MFKTTRSIILAVGIYPLLCGREIRAASDPWDPNRRFCGRLTIIIAGAGEFERPTPIDKTGKTMDILSVHTWANFLQFSRASAAGMPAYSIVMTSDPTLRNVLNQMSPSEKQIRGFLGVVPSSIDSFRSLLSLDNEISLLQKAITKCSENRDCKELMKEGGYDSVLPLLKVEIVIENENSNQQIPLWSDGSETGSLERWRNKKKPPVLGKELIQQLLERLEPATVHAFVASCEGATIGKYFKTSNQCTCYLSATDNSTLLFLSVFRAPFGAKLAEASADVITLQRTFSGTSNVLSMIPTLLSTNYRSLVQKTRSAWTASSLRAGGSIRYNPLLSPPSMPGPRMY